MAVCLEDGRYKEKPNWVLSPTYTISYWANAASRNGWTEITSKNSELSGLDRFAIENIRILNGALFGGKAIGNRSPEPSNAMLGGQIYSKSIDGRQLYLSLFGYEDGGLTVAECRAHDFLGDGVSKNPVSKNSVEKIAKGKVRKTKGPFGSTRYNWDPTRSEINQLDVHFGFKGWLISPFCPRVGDFDPYAPYGLTLVAGFHEQIIVT